MEGYDRKRKHQAPFSQLELKELQGMDQDVQERRRALRRLDDHLRSSGIYEPVTLPAANKTDRHCGLHLSRLITPSLKLFSMAQAHQRCDLVRIV